MSTSQPPSTEDILKFVRSLPSYEDIERMALGFALEMETWPVFLEWLKRTGNQAVQDWLQIHPSRDDLQALWLNHSDDPTLRRIGETVLRRRIRDMGKHDKPGPADSGSGKGGGKHEKETPPVRLPTRPEK